MKKIPLFRNPTCAADLRKKAADEFSREWTRIDFCTMKPMHASIETVRGWVERSRRIVALTGAGISTESGIPDFRGPKGLWTQNPKAEKLSDIRYYMADPEVRRLAWQQRMSHPAWHAKPNAGHLALVALEQS